MRRKTIFHQKNRLPLSTAGRSQEAIFVFFIADLLCICIISGVLLVRRKSDMVKSNTFKSDAFVRGA